MLMIPNVSHLYLSYEMGTNVCYVHITVWHSICESNIIYWVCVISIYLKYLIFFSGNLQTSCIKKEIGAMYYIAGCSQVFSEPCRLK